MKRLMIPGLFAIGVLALPAFAAPQQKAEPPAVPAAHSDAERMAERFCVRDTGSRIVSRQKKAENAEDFNKRCLAFNGRVYTREDIDRTGEVDLADALRKLDPAIH
jgi:hypothetical protein